MALFHFLLARAALASLPTTHYFSAGPVCSKFLRCSSRHSAIYPLVSALPTSLLFPFSCSLTLALFLSPCPLLSLSFYPKLSGRNYLLSSPLLSGYNGAQDTHFSRGTTWLMNWPKWGALLVPSAIPCSLSSRIYSLFSWSGGVLSPLNSLTHRFPPFPLKVCSSRSLCPLSSSLQQTQPTAKLSSL